MAPWLIWRPVFFKPEQSLQTTCTFYSLFFHINNLFHYLYHFMQILLFLSSTKASKDGTGYKPFPLIFLQHIFKSMRVATGHHLFSFNFIWINSDLMSYNRAILNVPAIAKILKDNFWLVSSWGHQNMSLFSEGETIINLQVMSEWLLLTNFSAISWQEQVKFQWDDDEVRNLLDQHDSADRYVAPLWHIIVIPSQPVFWSFSIMLRS